MDRFASNFDWGILESHRNVLCLVEVLRRVVRLLSGKIARIVICDKGRVNDGTKTMTLLVPKLVEYKQKKIFFLRSFQANKSSWVTLNWFAKVDKKYPAIPYLVYITPSLYFTTLLLYLYIYFAWVSRCLFLCLYSNFQKFVFNGRH